MDTHFFFYTEVLFPIHRHKYDISRKLFSLKQLKYFPEQYPSQYFFANSTVSLILVSYGELQFPPTAVPLQIKFGINFIPSTIACRFQRHVFICPIDHSPSFLYSLIVTNKKRERTAPTTVRSSSHSPRAAALIRCRVMP